MENQTTSNQIEKDKGEQGTEIPFSDELAVRIHKSAERNDKLEQRIANLERASSSNRWMVLLTAIAAFIALSGVVVSYFQWRTTLTLFYQDQRPHVTIHAVPIQFEPNKAIMVNLYSGNSGKTPATKVGGNGRIFLGNDAIPDAYRWFDTEAKNVFTRRTETIIRPGTSPANYDDAIRSTLSTNRIISDEEFRSLTARDFSIVVAFRTAYSDSAGNQYWTDICITYLATNAIAYCPQHNKTE